MRLGDLDALKAALNYIYDCEYIDSKSKEGIASDIIAEIDNAPTVSIDSGIAGGDKTVYAIPQGDLISRDDLRNARPEYMNEKVVRDTKYRTSKDRIYAKAWNACNHYWLNTIDTAPTVAPEATMRGKRMTVDYDLFREKLNALNDEIFKTTNEQQVLPVLAIHKILIECEV